MPARGREGSGWLGSPWWGSYSGRRRRRSSDDPRCRQAGWLAGWAEALDPARRLPPLHSPTSPTGLDPLSVDLPRQHLPLSSITQVSLQQWRAVHALHTPVDNDDDHVIQAAGVPGSRTEMVCAGFPTTRSQGSSSSSLIPFSFAVNSGH